MVESQRNTEIKELTQKTRMKQEDVFEILDYLNDNRVIIGILIKTIELFEYELHDRNYTFNIKFNHDPEFYDPYIRLEVSVDHEFDERGCYTKADYEKNEALVKKIRKYINKLYGKDHYLLRISMHGDLKDDRIRDQREARKVLGIEEPNG